MKTYLKRAYLESMCLKVVEAVLCFFRKIIPVGDFMQFVFEGSHLLLLKSYASVTPGRPFFWFEDFRGGSRKTLFAF